MAATADRASVYQVTQLIPEVTPGVALPATKRILDFMIDARPVVPTHPFRPMGSVAPSTLTIEKEYVTANYSGVQGYNSLIYPLNGLIKQITPSTPTSAVNTRLWSFKPSNFAPDTPATYTVEKGSSAGAERFAYGMFNSLALRWNRTEATLSGTMMGQALTESFTMTGSPTDIAPLPVDPRAVSVFVGNNAGTTNEVQQITTTGTPTGGTFTLTYDGQTTGNLAFNASAANVQAALVLLPNIGANNVVCAGGALPTAITITFQGALAGLDVSQITLGTNALTGGSTPTVVPVTNTPGSLTKLLRVSSAEVTLPDQYAYGFTLNQSTPSFDFFVDQGVEPTAQIVLEHDSASATLMTDLRNRTQKFCRIVSIGPQIETTVGNTLSYANMLVVTFPFKFLESDRGDVDAVYANTYNLGMQYDSTFAGWFQADVYNAIATL